MSTDESGMREPTKGMRIKAEVVERMSPRQREDYEVLIMEDEHGLTKVRIRHRLKTRKAVERVDAG